MIALPSIAYDAFAGTAKDVTARRVGGRTVLSVRATQSAIFTPAQAVSRNRLSKISRAFRNLTDPEMARWEQLARQYNASSSLGQGAAFTAHNIFVRLNCNLVMVGGSPITDAPIGLDQVPPVNIGSMYVNASSVRILGIEEPSDDLRLVVKMSNGQSVGVSSAWSRTVIVSSNEETDWGELELTNAFEDVLGSSVENGKKFFVEMYWVDSVTGFAGAVTKFSGIAGPLPIYGGSVSSRRSLVSFPDLRTESGCFFKNFEYELSKGSVIASCRGEYGYDDTLTNAEIVLDEQTASNFMAQRCFLLGRGNYGRSWVIEYLEVIACEMVDGFSLCVTPTNDYQNYGSLIFDTATPVNY